MLTLSCFELSVRSAWYVLFQWQGQSSITDWAPPLLTHTAATGRIQSTFMAYSEILKWKHLLLSIDVFWSDECYKIWLFDSHSQCERTSLSTDGLTSSSTRRKSAVLANKVKYRKDRVLQTIVTTIHWNQINWDIAKY